MEHENDKSQIIFKHIKDNIFETTLHKSDSRRPAGPPILPLAHPRHLNVNRRPNSLVGKVAVVKGHFLLAISRPENVATNGRGVGLETYSNSSQGRRRRCRWWYRYERTGFSRFVAGRLFVLVRGLSFCRWWIFVMMGFDSCLCYLSALSAFSLFSRMESVLIHEIIFGRVSSWLFCITRRWVYLLSYSNRFRNRKHILSKPF